MVYDPLEEARVHYHIVETPSMCQAATPILEKLSEDFPKISVFVHDSFPQALQNPLIVNIKGTIQYIIDYKETLSKVSQLNPLFIIVSNTPMTRSQTYARMQLNMPFRKLAQWVFCYAEFIAFITGLGYRLIYIENHKQDHSQIGMPKGVDTQVVSLVFARK